jgi:hypothetical protein
MSFLALAVLLMPDAAFSIVADTPWEVLLLRIVTLLGVSVVAILPWALTADSGVRQRLRIWSLPGALATVAYLFSTDPFYLLIGFCLLTGAALDTWTTRATMASESLRARLTPDQRRRR